MYETAGDYELEEEDKQQRIEQINALIEDFGEVVYVTELVWKCV